MPKRKLASLLCFSCKNAPDSESSTGCNEKALSVNLQSADGSVDALPYIARNPSVDGQTFKKGSVHDGSVKETISISTASQFGHHPGMGDAGSESLTGWSSTHHPDIDASKINLLLNEDSSIILRRSTDGNENVVNEAFCRRLEALVVRIERLAGVDLVSDGGCTVVADFQQLFDSELSKFVKLSETLGGDIKCQALEVKIAFVLLKELITSSSKYMKPSDSELLILLEPLKLQLFKITNFGNEPNHTRRHQLRTVGDSATALAWPCSDFPPEFLRDIYESTKVYANKVVQSCHSTLPQHVTWVRSWLAFLQRLKEVVELHYPKGLTWASTGPNLHVAVNHPAVIEPTPAIASSTPTRKEANKTTTNKRPPQFSKPPQTIEDTVDRGKLLEELSHCRVHLRHVPMPRVL